MSRQLSEMSHEELWQLFPIILTPHQSKWSEYYKHEKQRLEECIGRENIVRINHIGSTSVPGLIAKPTVDILMEINEMTDIDHLISSLEKMGYIYSFQPEKPAPHMMFMKGYMPKGFEGQTFHLHIRYTGDWDKLYFRDYLISHPKVAKEYEKLKLFLKEKFKYNRDVYTDGKTEFISRVNKKARTEK